MLFTDRVHDWELYKLRMLNATHSCMAYLMAIAGRRLRRRGDGDPRGAALPRAVPRGRGDPDARPRSPGIRLPTTRRTVLGRLREHGRARPDRPPLHRRDGEVPELPDPDGRAAARARRPGRVRGARARRLGALPRDGAGRRACARPARRTMRQRSRRRSLAGSARVPRARPRSSRRRLRESAAFRDAFATRPAASPSSGRSARSSAMERQSATRRCRPRPRCSRRSRTTPRPRAGTPRHARPRPSSRSGAAAPCRSSRSDPSGSVA